MQCSLFKLKLAAPASDWQKQNINNCCKLVIDVMTNFSLLYKIETSTSAGWNGSPGAPSTGPGGQQQLATQTSAQVVPVSASFPSTQRSLSSPDKAYTNSGAPAPALSTPQATQASLTSSNQTYTSNEALASAVSTPQSSVATQPSDQTYINSGSSASGIPAPQSSSVTSYNLTAATPSNSSADDSYPVYYVSNPKEPNTQQYFPHTASNGTINPSVQSPRSLNTASQSDNNDSYPVYYVSSYEEEKQKEPEANTESTTSSLGSSTNTNSHAVQYPVYYVNSYNKETPQAPKANSSTSSTAFRNQSLSEPPDRGPVYNIGVPKIMNAAGPVSKNKTVANSPISYKIINTTSASQDVTSSSSRTYSSPPASAAAAPSTLQTPVAQPASQPAATSYNYPSNPASAGSYQTGSAQSSPSTSQQAYNYYGYPASPPSPVTYQAHGAPSPATYSAPSPASQPASNYPGYPAYQASAAPSPAQLSVAQPASSLYPATAPAPAPAVSYEIPGVSSSSPSPLAQSGTSSNPVPAPASASASSPYPISGVSSSPPFPPGSQSSSSTGKNKTFTSAQVSKTSTSSNRTGSPKFQENVISQTSSPAHVKYPSLPQLESEYENASYIIATSPEKDTVLFLPSPSFPLSPDTTQDGNSTSVTVQTTSTQQVNATSFLNSSLPKLPTSSSSTNATTVQPTNITFPAIEPAMISSQATGNNDSLAIPLPLNATDTQEEVMDSPIIRIPENITLPGWELQNTAFDNITFMSNSSLEPPPPAVAPENLTSSTTPTPPPSTAAPKTLNNKTVSGSTFNIPLGPLLNSLAVTTPPHTSKPPQPQLITTPPTKPMPPPTTAKPPPVVVHPTTKPTEKTKEWGFGDKYLGM